MPDDRSLDSSSTPEQPAVRCKPVERNQLLLRAVDVEKLVDDQHEVRAIWELVGQLDLRAFMPRLGRWKGKRVGQSGTLRS